MIYKGLRAITIRTYALRHTIFSNEFALQYHREGQFGLGDETDELVTIGNERVICELYSEKWTLGNTESHVVNT